MLWLALQFPRLPLDVLGETSSATPFVVAETQVSRRIVVDGNDAAAACGIAPGMPLSAAQALCATLHVVPRRREDEARALTHRATWALRYTPLVTMHGEDAVLLEIATSFRLFGGLAPLLAQVRGELDALGYRVRAAAAPTPSAALLFARAGLGRAVASERRALALLRRVSLDHAAWPRATIEALHGVGLRVFGDLLPLPRAELARRFGQSLVDDLDRLIGRLPEPVDRFEVPARYHGALELPTPVEHAQALAFGAQRLLRELGDWLEAHQLALQRCALSFRHAGREPSVLELGLRRPSTDTAHLVALMRMRLESLELPDAVESLALEALELAPLPGTNVDLFERGDADDAGAERLVERLRSRLGDAVRQWRLRADHRPERAHDRRDTTAVVSIEPCAAERPLFLLETPRPLAEWPQLGGRRVTLVGPERIETGWWDEAPVRRDYYRAHTADGATFWIYREPGGADWFVHGIFA